MFVFPRSVFFSKLSRRINLKLTKIEIKIRIFAASQNLIRWVNVVFITTFLNSAIHLVLMVSHSKADSTCPIQSFETLSLRMWHISTHTHQMFTGIQFIRPFAFWINFKGNKLQSHTNASHILAHQRIIKNSNRKSWALRACALEWIAQVLPRNDYVF